MDKKRLDDIQNIMSAKLSALSVLQKDIFEELRRYSDGKTLKGNEIVGCLGEIYIKELFSGRLVADSYEHDVELDTGERISVKTRKGRNIGWNRTSAIPKLDGEGVPTHLAFVNLYDDYSVNTIWYYPWQELLGNNRFREHVVRGQHRSYIFNVDEVRDIQYRII